MEIGAFDGRCNARRRLIALDQGGVDHHIDERTAPGEYGPDVPQCSTGGRGDDTDAPWMAGQRPFPFGREQALRLELTFERLELQSQCALSSRLQVFDDELVVAACFVQPQAPADQDLVAITRYIA